MATELDTFYALVDELEIAMMTTRRSDGHLESRAMATQSAPAVPTSGSPTRATRATGRPRIHASS